MAHLQFCNSPNPHEQRVALNYGLTISERMSISPFAPPAIYWSCICNLTEREETSTYINHEQSLIAGQ